MSRDIVSSQRIALLATGDEISFGDILNTNSKEIAQRLFSQGMNIGLHMVAPDNITDIQHSIEFLLKSHRALIMTGGLGPTSDDITRYALAKALDLPLIFDEKTWEAICERFKQLGYTGAPPDGNRQQALFPEGAIIIPNPNGTAAGCLIEKNDQIIFMLPGPPYECLPMVDSIILPTLMKFGFQHVLYFDHWLLFGVSEGHIAEKLDALAKPYDCVTGYRLFYPYIEFKLHSNKQNDFDTLIPLVEEMIAPYLIGDGKQPASTMLQKKLEKFNGTLAIRDLATGGLLENSIKTPENYYHLNFATQVNPTVEIKGLNEYWQGKAGNETGIEITFADGQTIKKHIPFRGSRVKNYAVEFICQQILKFISNGLPQAPSIMGL